MEANEHATSQTSRDGQEIEHRMHVAARILAIGALRALSASHSRGDQEFRNRISTIVNAVPVASREVIKRKKQALYQTSLDI